MEWETAYYPSPSSSSTSSSPSPAPPACLSTTQLFGLQEQTDPDYTPRATRNSSGLSDVRRTRLASTFSSSDEAHEDSPEPPTTRESGRNNVGRPSKKARTTRDFVPPDVTGLSKREARLVKNRAAAFLSRQRKREEFEAMEIRVAELEAENARLRNLSSSKKSESPRPPSPEPHHSTPPSPPPSDSEPDVNPSNPLIALLAGIPSIMTVSPANGEDKSVSAGVEVTLETFVSQGGVKVRILDAVASPETPAEYSSYVSPGSSVSTFSSDTNGSYTPSASTEDIAPLYDPFLLGMDMEEGLNMDFAFSNNSLASTQQPSTAETDKRRVRIVRVDGKQEWDVRLVA